MNMDKKSSLQRFVVVASLGLTVVMAASATANDWLADTDLALRHASGVAELSFEQDEAVNSAESSAPRNHPQWMLDIESKMWPGFLTGMDGFDDFVMPVGMPIQFEDPFITTDIRPFYIYHSIPNRSALRGGQVQVLAAQVRIALSKRLALIATKDGYSWFDSHITAAGDGWNDISLGLKYALHVDQANQYMVSTGIRWEWVNGSRDALQGGENHELSPFISVAKGWKKWHFLGALTGRIATNRSAGNSSIVWNMHLDYELTETFRPLIEFHGIHWLTNADELPTRVDYLDVGSLGASNVAGRDFFSAGLGFRWQATKNYSVGLTYEFPLESASQNLQDHRVTLNTVLSF